MGLRDGSGISWTICKQSAPCSRQITTPTPHHSIFTGRMLFMTPNKHCQSTEGKGNHRQRIDKCLDTQRPAATAADRIVTNHSEKSQSQDGGLPEFIISLTCLTNHSKADRRRWPMTCRLLCIEQPNAVCKTCSHLAIITTAVVSCLFTGSATVASIY